MKGFVQHLICFQGVKGGSGFKKVISITVSISNTSSVDSEVGGWRLWLCKLKQDFVLLEDDIV